jgi:molecular chaperone DnaJ
MKKKVNMINMVTQALANGIAKKTFLEMSTLMRFFETWVLVLAALIAFLICSLEVKELEPQDHKGASGIEKEVTFPRKESCEICKGSGASPGTKPVTCPRCHGRGQIEFARSTGFAKFIQVTTCNQCNGRGQTIEKPCSTCHGTGVVSNERKIQVKIPAGIESGTRLRLSSEGEIGTRGGRPGDLYVVVHVRPHPTFHRNNSDLIIDVSIGFAQAALGAEIEVPTIEGKAKLTIPPGTQTHTVFRMRGKGLPKLRSFGKGNELVRIIVEIPTKLSSKQKELLIELANDMNQKVKVKKGIFG